MSVLRAIFLSLLIHAALAAVAVLLFSVTPAPTVRVELDLSSVDLSFAEQEAEAPPVQAAPAVLPRTPPPRPRAVTPPPEPPRERPHARPPEAAAPASPEPQVEIAQLEALPRKAVEEPPPAPSASAVAPSAPRQARVDAPPKPRRTIRPVYPDGARRRGEEGRATVEFLVGEDGRVAEARVVASTGFAELDAAALKAVRTARFTPARADGKAVAAPARLTLNFKLR